RGERDRAEHCASEDDRECAHGSLLSHRRAYDWLGPREVHALPVTGSRAGQIIASIRHMIPQWPRGGLRATVSALLRRQDRQFQLAGEVERDLGEPHEAVARVIERALAAFAAEHAVRVPAPGKAIAALAQVGDEVADRRIVEMRADIGAELGDDAAGTLVVIV